MQHRPHVAGPTPPSRRSRPSRAIAMLCGKEQGATAAIALGLLDEKLEWELLRVGVANIGFFCDSLAPGDSTWTVEA